jgi:hypothetical protein
MYVKFQRNPFIYFVQFVHITHTARRTEMRISNTTRVLVPLTVSDRHEKLIASN